MAKGRSMELIKLRNKKLIERYFFWSEVKRRRFDDTIKILSKEEFFISESTIVRLIADNSDYFQELVNKKQTGARQGKLF